MKFAFKNRRRGKTREKRDASFQSFERFKRFPKTKEWRGAAAFPFFSLSFSLSLNGFLLRRGNARTRAPLLSGFLALSLLYSCCGFPFSLFEHEDVLVFNSGAERKITSN